MKAAPGFFKEIMRSRYLLFQLIRRNVTDQYRRSRLGMFWSLIEPLAFMGILYIVFGIGLRGGRTMEIPFITYLVTGIAVLNFFTTVMNKAAISVRTHSYLLRKININLSILPIVTVAAGIVDHLFFLAAAIAIILAHGILPHWIWFQIIYYLISLGVLLLGISWFTAAVGVFLPDLQHMVTIVSRMMFYFSPVFWDYAALSPQLQSIVRLNPLFYIVRGYRDSFFSGIPFWERTDLLFYFWAWALGMVMIGSLTFRKLRPQFADLL